MSDEQRSDACEDDEELYTFQDDEGGEFTCRLLDRITMRAVEYAVLAELEDEQSILIFRIEKLADGTEELVFIEDEVENEEVFDLFRITDEDYEFCDAE